MKFFVNKKIKNTYLFIKYIFIFIISFFILFLILKEISSSNNILGYRFYNIDKDNDYYKKGDIVISQNVSLKTISIGDYVVIRDKSDIKNDNIVIGRIKDINYDLDNRIKDIDIDNNGTLVNASSKQIIGKIIYKVPIISFIYKLFIYSYGLIIIIPILLIIIFDYLFRYYRKKSEEIDVI